MKQSSPEFGLYSSRILLKNGFFDGTMIVKDGLISKLIPGKYQGEQLTVKDLNDLVVMPGIIDSHVHINEPGRTEWEGFESMTKAAISGGITTLIDMPLNSSPVTIDTATFLDKQRASEGKLYCDCGFWGGIVPDNLDQLEDLLKAGVFGIKAFLTHSGIDEFPNVNEEELERGLEILSRFQKPLLAHCELDQEHAGLDLLKQNPNSYEAYLNSRPKSWEDDAVRLMIRLCRKYQTPVHIVHLSSANTLDEIRQAKAEGLPLTVETCPQYLYFNAEDIPDGNTLYKCAPPIREKANNDLLWEAVLDGTIDFIVTDHSPAPPSIKEIESGNLLKAWGGISSIQFALPVVWTAGKKHQLPLEKLAFLMAEQVARFLGIQEQKGHISEGARADLVVWDPEAQFKVQSMDIHYRHPVSPYIGETLYGVVHECYLGGHQVFDQGNFVSQPLGNVLLNK
ncbi:MAG: allantoinase AllB [Bacteroidetes bacterium]|nr:MAG: allantoinase AllB [Bacteroidota bacterium]